MTRKTKRQLEKELEQLKSNDSGDIEVTSSVVTITGDMTDGNGNLIDGPSTQAPDEYELGDELETNSPVVTVHELE